MAATVLAVVSIIGFGFSETASAAGRRPSDVPKGEDARVTRVIDGDSIEVTLLANSQTVTVKYIGINAPAANECYGAQATAANKSLINTQRVVLEKDAQDTDATGALLRYVYLIDGRMANEELLMNGSAQSSVEQPNLKYQGDFESLVAQAYSARQGLWGRCKVAAPQRTYSSTVCATIRVEDLMARTEVFLNRTLLHAGDCVKIVKAENAAGEAWQGQYVFHPKGSVVKLNNGYLRWKDAFVPMTLDENGNAFVFKSQVFPAQFNRGGPGQRPSVTPARTEAGMSQLERVPQDTSILRLPGLTNLFRDKGNGQYEVLVDFFSYVSGDLRNPVLDAKWECEVRGSDTLAFTLPSPTKRGNSPHKPGQVALHLHQRWLVHVHHVAGLVVGHADVGL